MPPTFTAVPTFSVDADETLHGIFLKITLVWINEIYIVILHKSNLLSVEGGTPHAGSAASPQKVRSKKKK